MKNLVAVNSSLLSICAWCALSLLSQPARAQAGGDSTGLPQASSTFPIEHGFINLNNGNVHLEIPIENYAQRGDINFPVTLVYDSMTWQVLNQDQWEPMLAYPYQLGTWGGWHLQYANFGANYNPGSQDSFSVACITGDEVYAQVYPDVQWSDPHGTDHLFPATTVSLPSGCTTIDGNTYQNTASASAYATDGSGYYATVSNYTNVQIYDQHGTLVYGSTATLGPIDRNGNYVTGPSFPSALAESITDTLNRTPITITDNGDNETLVVPLAQGGSGTYTINFTIIPLQTAFSWPDVQEFSGTMAVVKSLVLPDGTSYEFGYEEGTYGELNSVTLPHGGAVSFTYQNNPGLKNFRAEVGILPSRWVSSHTGSDGTTNFAWSYKDGSPWSELGLPCGQITNAVTNTTTANTYIFSICNNAMLPREVTHRAIGSSYVEATELYNYDVSHPCPTVGTHEIYHVCYGAQWRNLIGKTVVLSSPGVPSLTTDTQYGYLTPGSGIPTSIKQWDYYQASPTSLPDSPPGLPTRETDQTLGYVVNNALVPTVVTNKDSTGATVATTTYTYDEAAYQSGAAPSTTPNHGDQYVTGNRGNPTTIAQCCGLVNGVLATLTSHLYYDDAGAITAVLDPNGNKTTFGYDATDTFPQEITSPPTTGLNGVQVPHVTQNFYDPNSGQITSIIDENNQTTTYNYDSVGRLQTISLPNGGSPITLETVTYPSVNESDVATLQSPGVTLSSATIVDGYGRMVQTKQGNVTSEISYDALGRVYSITNPHYPSPSSSDGTTYYYYDELGRSKSVTLPNTYSVGYSYTLNTETVTDPLQHSREFASDAFGDLTSVLEPNSTGTLSLTTAYQYNWQSKLTQVQQEGGVTDTTQWRTRTFAYDGVGRLSSQTTQEAGTETFYYDANGNLTSSQNQNATNNKTSYTYDADNRLISQTVAGGPSYSYTYDAQDSSGDPYGIGRLTGTTDASNVQTLITHDALGRVVSSAYCLPSNCSFSYKVLAGYDYQGNLLSLTYPDGRSVGWTYDQLNRPLTQTYAQWGSTSVNASYLSNLSYYPGGQLQQATYGNGVQVGATYDSDQNLSSLAYLVKGVPMIAKTYVWDKNASNLLTISDAASGRTQTFTYDQLDRLASMTDTGSTTAACVAGLTGIPASAQTFSIDSWGNLKQSGTSNFVQNFSASNRISATGYVYDSAGNMTADGLGNTYQYRSDGLMSASSGSTYTYDALGQRVRKDSSSASLEYIYFGGQLLAMRNPSTGAWTDRIYGPDGALATVAGSQTAIPAYRAGDHLGSLSNVLDGSGNVTGTTSALPFGQLTINTSGDNFPFTDHERDAENGTDATLLRHYSPAQGRWLSPDPYNGSYSLADPQSLNRYAYVTNRPMARVDRLGGDDDDDDDDDDDGGCGCGGGGPGGGGGGGGGGGYGWPPPKDPSGPSDLGSIAWEDPSSGAVSAEAVLWWMSPTAGLSGNGSVDSSPGLDLLQDGLNILGVIPEVGVLANGVNAGISAARGHYAQAGLYTAAAGLSFIAPGASALGRVHTNDI